jgi:hypothetical protein
MVVSARMLAMWLHRTRAGSSASAAARFQLEALVTHEGDCLQKAPIPLGRSPVRCMLSYVAHCHDSLEIQTKR